MSKPPKKPAPNPLRHLRASDVRAATRLTTQAITAIQRITEGVHQSVLGTLGMPQGKTPGRTGGITGLVYKAVHGITQLVAKGVDAPLAALQPLLDRFEGERPETSEREVAIAILNGVVGDHLVATGNPLALSMSLRWDGLPLDASLARTLSQPSAKVMVLVHGLCMSDTQWHTQTKREDSGPPQVVDHGQALAAALGCSVIRLRYNTGLHTSQNGRQFAAQLEQLLKDWPVPIEELTLLGYSMGGLVTRSACHHGQAAGMRWPKQLKQVVFLATPHHGAPLERAGNWLDAILGSNAYSAPYGSLIKLRSAGITDLRHGHVVDEDWLGHDRFRRAPDRRRHVPLPEGVKCYALAATLAGQRSPLADRLIGDGLVPLPSALGQHEHAHRTLGFAKTAQAVFFNMGHLDVLSRPEVSRQLIKWLRPSPPQ